MLPLSFVGAPLEMTKRRWRELMQALYENHFDPRKDEELKQSKLDIENKLPKILKLVKERRSNRRNRNVEANLRKESELIELIEDFHKQYEFVYGQYDDIRGQLSQTVNGAKVEEGYFTATSSSDSDTESEKEESVSSEGVKAINKAHKSEKMMQELKEKLDEKGREVSSLVGIQKSCQREISGLMKDLESEFSSLNRKLDEIRPEKVVTEQTVVNRRLQDRALKLEEIAKEMDDKMSQLSKDGLEGVIEEEGMVSDMSMIKMLVMQVNDLKLNVDCLFSDAQKSNSEQQKMNQGSKYEDEVYENLQDQVKKMKTDLKLNMDCLFSNAQKTNSEQQKMNQGNENEDEKLQDQVKKMKSDLGFMRKKNTELESDIKKKAEENSGFLSEIYNLKKEVANKTQELEKIQKERDDSVARMKNLELEADKLMNQRSEREELMARKEQEHLNNDICKLTAEKESLQGTIMELEKKLQDKADEYSKLQNDMFTQIEALTREVNKMQQEKDMKINSDDKEISELGKERESLQEKVMELEDEIFDLHTTSQVEGNEVSYLQGELSVERKKFLERLNELETQNNELSFKVSDQEFMIKQHEDTIQKLRGDCKLVKGRFLQAAERKMDEVAEEFRKNFEDQLRMLSRRVRVAEQLHVETKESWKRTQERCEMQHPGLQKKLAEMIISASEKSELKTTVSQGVDEMMKGMKELVSNFESKEDEFLQRLLGVSNEVEVTKNWVRWTMDGIKPGKNEPSQGLPYQPMMDDKEQDKMMKEKVKRLEVKVNKEKGDKLRLIRGMYEMQKKVAELEKEVVMKDEGLLRLGEEKVEAIRQLCMWVDYQQSRFDHQLREMMMVVKKSKRRGTA